MNPSRMDRISAALAKRLLSLFPASFRDDYGQDLLRTLHDGRHDACRRHGWRGALKYDGFASLDLFVSALRERGREGRHRMKEIFWNDGGPLMILGAALGVTVFYLDTLALFNHDTVPFTLALLILCGGALGLIDPRKPWRWSLSIGIWLSIGYLAKGILQGTFSDGARHAIPPGAGLVLLLLIGLVASGIGAYCGAGIRWALSEWL
jgi:hypothetical protein